MKTKEEFITEAKRCLNCKDAPCRKACPAHNPIPEFMTALKTGNFEQAKALWDTTSNLPEICGRLCQNESLCVGHCTLNKVNRPIRIGELESGVADLFTGEVVLSDQHRTEKHLVIGLGPAGIANAFEMAKFGYSVDAIDANKNLGGALDNFIPSFRFDRSVIQGIQRKFEKLGIKTLYNVRVGSDLFLEDLLPKYDSIFIATGSDLPQTADIESDGLLIYYAHDLLNRDRYSPEALGSMLGKHVGVVGLGNVAVDMARVLIRLNKKVTIFYRRSIEEAPAGKKEVSEAESEGISIYPLSLPRRWSADQEGRHLTLNPTRIVIDENNTHCVVCCEEDTFTVDLDDLVYATGQRSSDMVFNGTQIRLKQSDSPYTTSDPKVFVGGDRINKNKRIVDAMVSGIEVARIINGGNE